METKAFRLDNGNFLYRDYGKYRSGLVFISEKEFFIRPTEIITNKKPIEAKKITFRIGEFIEHTSYLSMSGEVEGEYWKEIGVGEYGYVWVYKEMNEIKQYALERWGGKKLEKGFKIIDEREIILYDIETVYIVKPIYKIEIPYSGELIGVVEGQYRKNKKGTDIFDLNRQGDLLVVVNWGGAHKRSRGIEIDKIKNYKYYRHASSDGGGTGTDWLVIPKNFKLELSEDDF